MRKFAPGVHRVRVHMIADDTLMADLSTVIKMVPNAWLLERRKTAGRVAADAFLEAHWDDLGQRGTTDLEKMFG